MKWSRNRNAVDARERMLSDRVHNGVRIPYWSVPRDWEGETCVVIGTGQSLTQEQVDYCKGKARIIAVNNAFEKAPWADVLYACDWKWWNWYSMEAIKFEGIKATLDPLVPYQWGVELLNNTGREGFDDRPWCLKTGSNSAYQAVHLAAHFGAKRIILIGVDHHGTHYFGKHPDKAESPFALFIECWKTLVEPMKERGIKVFNCTPGTALKVWPMGRLEGVL